MTIHRNTTFFWWRAAGLLVLTATGLAMIIASGSSNDAGSDETNSQPTLTLSGLVSSMAENTDTSSAIRVATIVVADDGNGTNSLSLSGVSASLFEIAGTELQLQAGAALDFETAPSLSVTVNVDDTSVGNTPDDSVAFTLEITDVDEGGNPALISFPPTPPMTPAERMAAFGIIQSEIDSILPSPTSPWDQRDLGTEVKDVAERLAALPEVLMVFYNTEFDKSATIIMADGFPIHFVNNRPPRGVPQLPLKLTAQRTLSTVKFASTQTVIPGKQAAVATSYDGGQPVADEIAQRLQTADYAFAGLGPSLGAMRNYRDLGFLHIDSHGGSYGLFTITTDSGGNATGIAPVTDPDGNYQTAYVIETSTFVDASTLGNFSTEINDGELALSISQTDSGSRVHFAITEKFIRANWSFDNAAVIMHTCWGGGDPFNYPLQCAGADCPAGTATIDPRPIRNAILASGANVLMSFTDDTWSTPAAPSIYYFLDRLLGDNVEAPTDPAGRSFDWQKVRTRMEELGLLSFLNGASLNRVTLEGSGEPAVLAPSIRYMDMADDRDNPAGGKLSLLGDFGDQAGELTVDGLPLPVTSWSNNRVETEVPYGTPAYGDVRVETPVGGRSNEVPLTEWTGKIVVTLIENNALLRQFDIDVRFRGDVHKYRDKPDEPPRERVTTSYISSPVVQGLFTAAGTWTDPDLIGAQPILFSGGAELLIHGKAAIDDAVNGGSPSIAFSGVSDFAGLVELDPARNEARFCLWMNGYHEWYDGGELRPRNDTWFSLSSVAIFLSDSNKGSLRCVHATLEDDYSIPDGKKSLDLQTAFYEIEWKNFSVVSSPTSDTTG